MKPRLLIIEDEEAIRKGLCDLFVFNGYEVASAGDGKTGLAMALTGGHHAVLLDIMLPEMDGLTVCDKIREKLRTLPIIMLTAKGDEDDIVKGLKLGADDYVPKPFSVKELLARVEAVLRRNPKFAHEKNIIRWHDLTIDPANLTLSRRDTSVEITRREADLLNYFIRHQDRPVSRGELLKEVWGYAYADMETRTVDIHIAKLRRKLGDDPDNPRIIVTVRGEGYRIIDHG